MKKILLYFIGFGLIFNGLSINKLYAQEEEEDEVQRVEVEEVEPLESTLNFKMTKLDDGSRELRAAILAETEDGSIPLSGVEVNFYQNFQDDVELIGTSVSDKYGIAVYNTATDQVFHMDEELLTTIMAEYSGNDTIAEISEEISFQDLFVSLNAELVDSVKTIIVEANYFDADSNLVPLNEEEILVYIQGLYSRLQVGEIWMEEGYGEVEFPDDLPGDVDGNLKIFISLNEHDRFAFVEKMSDQKWGVGFESSDKYKPALWTSQAPLWMIIVLIILLSGVWGHYIFAFIQLRKINRSGKALNQT